MNGRPPSVVERLQRFADQLKSSTLLLIAATLFVADLFIPDPLPFVDEIVLGLVTLLIARWQSRRQQPAAPKPPPKDVTPPTGN